MRGSRVTQNAFERLELYAVKVARTVLRRAVSGNRHRLSDSGSKDTYTTPLISFGVSISSFTREHTFSLPSLAMR